MNVKRVEFTESERMEIQGELRKDHAAHVYKRLMALKLKAVDGMRSDEAGKLLGLYASSINRIANRYKAEGMEAIVGKRHHGGHRYMTLEEDRAFLARFREQGEAGKAIEVTDIHLAFQEAVGHSVTKDAIYYLLKKHGWRKVMPRGQHPKKASAEAIEAYKKITETIQTLKKSQPNLRVMFQDEVGFGRINKPKRCWCPSGIRPSVPCHHIREYRFLYGAASPADGKLFALVLPYTNTVCMNVFLRELSKAYPNDYILLIMDNAAWHSSGALQVPENIRLYPLLPYTSELNPIEMLWDEIREKGFLNEIFASLEKVVDRLCDCVRSLFRNPDRVASITHRQWLLCALAFYNSITCSGRAWHALF